MKKLTLIALATLALAACGDNGSPPEEREASSGTEAPAEPAPVPAEKADARPAGTFAHAPDCAELPAPAAAICLRPVLVAGEAKPDLSVEIARIDVDRDGTPDMVLRRRSKNDCGPNGCATYVLFARDGAWVEADPPINADGPVETCLNDGKPGVRFPLAGPDASCIAVTPQI